MDYPICAKPSNEEHAVKFASAEKCPACGHAADEFVEQLMAIELPSRPLEELRRLASDLAGRWDDYKGLGRPIQISVLGGFTTDYLVDLLRLMLLRRRLAAEINAAGYGLMASELLTGGPSLRNNPDVVVMLPTHRDLRYAPAFGCTRAEADAAVEQEVQFWLSLIQKSPAPVVMLSFDQPEARVLEELNGFAPGSLGRHARATNMVLFDRLPQSASFVDAEALQSRLGRFWHDPYVFSLCKQPFSMKALPEVADTLAAQIVATLGAAKKVLVLDLDNTLWGGVVGDVGGENLELGPETPEGEAFDTFQRYVQSLSRRGVILALCSKNNEDIAWSTFQNHPAMVLKENDVAAFVVNFDDKAANIRKIAETLNVGIDSLAFADDNPVERAWVHRQLPEVAVIDMPENPAHYAQALAGAKLFPMTRITREDIDRSASYKAIAVARDVLQAASDMDAFLRDLSPVATIEAVDERTFDRIFQLIGKTNQFKLNPRVFSLEEIRQRPSDIIALRLSDRLQDYGIIAVAVTETKVDVLWIQNWVMSCRVFGRRAEHAMRGLLDGLAQRNGAKQLALNYIPSIKNGLVPDALRSVGFANYDGGDVFMATVKSTAEVEPHYMNIVDKRN